MLESPSLIECGYAYELRQIPLDRLPIAEWILKTVQSGKSIRACQIGRKVLFRESGQSVQRSRFHPETLAEKAASVFVTPEQGLPGWRVACSRGRVVAQRIVGVRCIPEWGLATRLIAPSRLARLQSGFEGAGEIAGRDLRMRAAELAGNAVIGLGIDYFVNAQSMYVLSLQGIAVKMVPVDMAWAGD